MKLFEIKFSLLLGWAFMWRFALLFGMLSYTQMYVVNNLVHNIDSGNVYFLFIISLCVSIMIYLPFVMTSYWLLRKGVLFRITKKYSKSNTPTFKHHKNNLIIIYKKIKHLVAFIKNIMYKK